MASGRGTLAMQRLGVRLIEQRNPEDAIVLGDAIQEAGIDGLITGRSRPVMFRAVMRAAHLPGRTFASITSPAEREAILRTCFATPAFFVQGYEVIHNVGRFAAKPNEERWNRIWSAWFTPRRATYRALVDAQLLPSSIRFHELRWRDVLHLPADVALAYDVYLERVPPRRKKPIDAYLFSVVRRDEDNPRTWERHFDEDYPSTWPQQEHR